MIDRDKVYSCSKSSKKGFTLIEILLSLAIIAIALTALLKASAQNTLNTSRIKDKTISQWVGTQAVAMIQSGLLQLPDNRAASQVTTLFGQRWYWQARTNKTAFPQVYELRIQLSKTPTGPFRETLTAFWYKKNAN